VVALQQTAPTTNRPPAPVRRDIATVLPGGRLRLHLHSGQWAAWTCLARFILVLAGTQGGKTSFGPFWLWREIQQQGPGDYMVIAPTFPLLKKKALPEFLRLFNEWLQLGHMNKGDLVYTFTREGAKRMFGCVPDVPTRIMFGYALNPESLESATAKAAWLDEAGQNQFKLGAWEAILRRLSLNLGRVLLTTTPYNLGWLKQQVYDRWAAGDPDYAVISFPSTANPNFPKEEAERARNTLPFWKYAMFYLAKFTRPAGLIYDCFNEQQHTCPRFPIPPHWKRYVGLDFGPVHTAALFYAEEPETGILYAYREYLAGGRVAAGHVKALLGGEPGIPVAVGGAGSEDNWRDEFGAAGLPVRKPQIRSVDVGIDRVYGRHQQGQIIVFDDLAHYLAEKLSYSRKLAENGDVLDAIEDKNSYHLMDAERYIVSWLTVPEGQTFQRDWFTIHAQLPAQWLGLVRYWILADPGAVDACTTGILLLRDLSDHYWVVDVARGQWDLATRDRVIRQTAEADARRFKSMDAVRQVVQQSPGSGGREQARHFVQLLQGFRCGADRVSGDSDLLLEPFRTAASAGQVHLLAGDWQPAFLTDLAALPYGAYRDQPDAVGGAYRILARLDSPGERWEALSA
jgi:predicted phage terminase large subunit-like protein